MKEFKVYCKPHNREHVLDLMLKHVEGSKRDEGLTWTDLTSITGCHVGNDGVVRFFEDGDSVDHDNTILTVTPDLLETLVLSNLNVEIDNTPCQFEQLTVNDVIREKIVTLKYGSTINPERLLQTASETIGNRAAIRDTDTERSMARTVNIFNAMTGLNLTERQGWEFMISLKLARGQQGGFNEDDYVDLAGYTALLAEHLCSLE